MDPNPFARRLPAEARQLEEENWRLRRMVRDLLGEVVTDTDTAHILEEHDDFCNALAEFIPLGWDTDDAIERLIMRYVEWLEMLVGVAEGPWSHSGDEVSNGRTVIQIHRSEDASGEETAEWLTNVLNGLSDDARIAGRSQRSRELYRRRSSPLASYMWENR